jgi:hypothetical protein
MWPRCSSLGKAKFTSYQSILKMVLSGEGYVNLLGKRSASVLRYPGTPGYRSGALLFPSGGSSQQP